ncbi:aerotolerance regulator BatC [Winogradskyella litorisediminis]|uniref:Aerotolerance regulator BatC n=1 Tax=Winogradskyella litorisediminis TaxID=1156618 RepID=A0ABW3N5R0_9FLAO
MNKKNIKILSTIVALLVSVFGFTQDFDKEQKKAQRESKDLVYEANELLEKDKFIAAEMEYRKAISKQKNNAVGAYNLGNSYYQKGNYSEALFRHQEAANNARTKEEKHRAFHNIGNVLMQNKKCKEAVEAFKNALRNNPNDEETRYNFALAKECAKQQQDQDGGGDDNKEDENKDDKKDEDKEKENKDKEQQEKDKKDEEGEEDKKKGDDEKDKEGEQKEDKNDDGKGDKEKQQKQPKPQPGKMSPQQIKNILEAMNNQEQKVQEKINAKKQKGARVKTEKDW